MNITSVEDEMVKENENQHQCKSQKNNKQDHREGMLIQEKITCMHRFDPNFSRICHDCESDCIVYLVRCCCFPNQYYNYSHVPVKKINNMFL